MKEIDKQQLDEIIENQENYILLLGSAYCGPCKMLKIILEQIESDMNSMSFGYIDLSKEKEIAKLYNISTVPFLIFIRKGKVIYKDRILDGDAIKDAIKDRYN